MTETQTLAGDVQRGSSDVATDVMSLKDRLTKILRESVAGNRRAAERIVWNKAARIRVAGQWRDCTILDISASGALLEPLEGLSKGEATELDIPGFGQVSARVVRLDGKARGIELDMDSETTARLREILYAETRAA